MHKIYDIDYAYYGSDHVKVNCGVKWIAGLKFGLPCQCNFWPIQPKKISVIHFQSTIHFFAAIHLCMIRPYILLYWLHLWSAVNVVWHNNASKEDIGLTGSRGGLWLLWFWCWDWTFFLTSKVPLLHGIEEDPADEEQNN